MAEYRWMNRNRLLAWQGLFSLTQHPNHLQGPLIMIQQVPWVPSTRIRQVQHEADQSSVSSASDKNAYSFPCSPQICLHCVVLRNKKNFNFTLFSYYITDNSTNFKDSNTWQFDFTYIVNINQNMSRIVHIPNNPTYYRGRICHNCRQTREYHLTQPKWRQSTQHFYRSYIMQTRIENFLWCM
jgi:hypothetical protein